MTARGRVEQRRPVDDPRARDEHDREPGAMASKHVGPIEPVFSVVTGERMNTTLLRAKSSSSADRLDPQRTDASSGSQGS